MEPRPLTVTLTLILAFAFLTADSPVLILSLPVSTPPPRPLPPPQPRSSSPPPPPSPSSRPPLSRPPPLLPPRRQPRSPPPPLHHMMPFWPPRPFAKPSDVQGPSGRSPPFPAPASCSIAWQSACGGHQSRHSWSGQPPSGFSRSTARGVGGLNLGKKVGLTFVAVVVVLQIGFGGFLIYKRRQIRKDGYGLDVASSSAG